jgi:hypothetical protein
LEQDRSLSVLARKANATSRSGKPDIRFDLIIKAPKAKLAALRQDPNKQIVNG